MNNQGFTLIELLIAIAIISILLILALPNLLGVRGNAIRNSAYAYTRSCATTMTNYALDNPDVDMVGMRCDNTVLNAPSAPSYVTRSIVVSLSTGMAIEYDYVVNNITRTASIPLNLK